MRFPKFMSLTFPACELLELMKMILQVADHAGHDHTLDVWSAGVIASVLFRRSHLLLTCPGIECELCLYYYFFLVFRRLSHLRIYYSQFFLAVWLLVSTNTLLPNLDLLVSGDSAGRIVFLAKIAPCTSDQTYFSM